MVGLEKYCREDSRYQEGDCKPWTEVYNGVDGWGGHVTGEYHVTSPLQERLYSPRGRTRMSVDGEGGISDAVTLRGVYRAG